MRAPTFDELIRAAAKALTEAGIEDARQNANLLMLAAFGDTRAALISAGNAPVPKGVQDAFAAALVRRLTREPVQHILGHTDFYGLEILSDARALVPRADSEIVVERALAYLPPDADVQVADLGTGTGCLLAAILSQRPRRPAPVSRRAPRRLRSRGRISGNWALKAAPGFSKVVGPTGRDGGRRT